jgi:two-component system, chemotaxis family, sensor histidine kinase and response regulator PixL
LDFADARSSCRSIRSDVYVKSQDKKLWLSVLGFALLYPTYNLLTPYSLLLTLPPPNSHLLMDTDRQIRLNFLDEAEKYFDQIESNLLGLADKEIDPQQIDIMLRAAHSVKGAAGMMGFGSLGRVAHRLEDFFKILRVRYAGNSINIEVETYLLQGVDRLRQISDLHRQDVEVADTWIDEICQPIFDRLRSYLGDLQATDEDALMAVDENVNPALLMFEAAVEGVLDRFEAQLIQLSSTALSQELAMVAKELIAFGQMADLTPFIELCQSIQQQAKTSTPTQISSLSAAALKSWRRSHALVQRGKIDLLPSQLDVSIDDDVFALVDLAELQTAFKLESQQFDEDYSFDSFTPDCLTELQTTFDLESSQFDSESFELESLPELQTAFDLADRQDVIGSSPLTNLRELQTAIDNKSSQVDDELSIASFDLENLAELQTAFDLESLQFEEDSSLVSSSSLDSLTELQAAFDLESPQFEDDLLTCESFDLETFTELQTAFDLELPELSVATVRAESSQPSPPVNNSIPNSVAGSSAGKMVRVPLSQLQQFNNLFGQLILERNVVNLRLKQLQNVAASMRPRMEQIEQSNYNLKQWYDRAALSGHIPENPPPVARSLLSSKVIENRFDALELDRYDDVHLICQSQIETIVQLQEVTTDVELGLQEIGQAMRDLDRTTKSLQRNVIRTQMVPFAEVVSRFPRVIRDLNLQFGKQVNLKIIGENTSIDRSVLEALSDPLMHLFRNAFDHGIEAVTARIAAGKSPQGTIGLQAINTGDRTVITISDDGGGIPLNKIRDRIFTMGIPRSQIDKMNDNEILEWIFEPGFSTAEKVTELSGRGVGMDVVRTNLRELRGDVRVQTQPGIGTTFTLQIPFSLSISRVAIVERAAMVFAIPATIIRELVPYESERVTTTADREQIDWHGELIPLIRLENILKFSRPHPNATITGYPAIDRSTIVIVGNKPNFYAIQISRFWSEQEATIGQIQSPLPLPPGFTSAIVFGDGRVIPLLDYMPLATAYFDRSRSTPHQPTNLQSSIAKTQLQTILVVDDSITVRRLLSSTLERAGYRVEQAKDGQEAVEKLLGGLQVAAVICDVEMPRLDGYGVLEELRSRAEFQNLPIAMLTSRSNDKHRKLAINLGASAYFSKPYNEPELLEKLAELLQHD